jgi:hypothetical protein
VVYFGEEIEKFAPVGCDVDLVENAAVFAFKALSSVGSAGRRVSENQASTGWTSSKRSCGSGIDIVFQLGVVGLNCAINKVIKKGIILEYGSFGNLNPSALN